MDTVLQCITVAHMLQFIESIQLLHNKLVHSLNLIGDVKCHTPTGTAGYVKEWKILEWALPHSKWLRSRAWLVGKSRSETIDICENEEGRFDDVEGDHEGEEKSTMLS